MSKHTSLPWEAWPNTDYMPTLFEISNPSDPDPIADVHNQADAEFILRAVNNHDALISALETLLFWQDAAPSEPIANDALLQARKRAHEAIAQAKGETP